VLREVAEYPNSFIPLGRRDERIETDRFTLCMGAGSRWNTVQRQRFDGEDLDDVLVEVRGLLLARGRTSTLWEVGSASQPAGLVGMLLERGLEWDNDPHALAMLMTSEPPLPPDHIVARRVASFEEYVAANEVQWEAFDTPASELAEQRTMLAARWAETTSVMHAVWLDGELVGAGSCAPTPHGVVLFGGATVARARGRGAYRALIRARWCEAVGLGVPALLTQAGAMSAPILERLGFERVGAVDLLVDEFECRHDALGTR
jgi:RimJ/RimL family protein N-acetyltransferase